MVAASRITRFLPAAEPIITPTTKFGGQPTWLADPAWPVSEGWGTPMRFVCQVALDGDRLAYVFVTHPEHDDPDFFDPDIAFADGRQGRFLVQDS